MKPSPGKKLIHENEGQPATEVNIRLSEDNLLWDQFWEGNESAFVCINKKW